MKDKNIKYYLDQERILSHNFEVYILPIVSYLNREIQIHQLNNDTIRNMNDAYDAIHIWNEQVRRMIEFKNQHEELLKMPDLDIYIVNKKSHDTAE